MNHLIDPRSGLPVKSSIESRAMLSCIVLAPSSVEADVYAKVVFLCGYPAGLDGLPDGMAGLCVFTDGTFAPSPSLEAYLAAQATTKGYRHA
jgi:thiamine biosynthesis lipoprotein ApbE